MYNAKKKRVDRESFIGLHLNIGSPIALLSQIIY